MVIKDKIITALRKTSGSEDITLKTPEIESHGDYSSNIAMVIASKQKNKKTKKQKNPRDLAEEIVSRLKEDKDLGKVVEKIKVAGPGFINFWLTGSVLVSNLEKILKEKGKYGSSGVIRGKKILLEHTSPNTIKTLHLGHVRNNTLGMAVHNILEFAGADVTLDEINNDRGIHVMKAVWAYQNFDDRKTPQTEGQKPDQFVDQFYVSGAKAYDEDPKVKREVQSMLQRWEEGDEEIRQVWKKLRDWTLDGFKVTYQRLGSAHDHQWFESEYYEEGKQIVKDGLKEKVFTKIDGGAVLSQLEKYKLPDTIILREDGTSMYHTQDLRLTQLKREKFPVDIYIWCVGPEQTLYLKQLFAMCEQLGFGKKEDYLHLSFGLVHLKGKGKMSSRKGTIVTADWLMDEMVGRAKEIIKNSETGESFKKGELERIAEVVGIGAIKYGFLKPARNSDIHFDIDESLTLQGNSGPYLQYTYARTQSVLRKAKLKTKNLKLNVSLVLSIKLNDEEVLLLRSFIHFQAIISNAAKNYSPNLLCNYLYELAQKFNTFYSSHQILTPEVKAQKLEVRNFRLALTATTGTILKNGLTLLGIQAPERM